MAAERRAWRSAHGSRKPPHSRPRPSGSCSCSWPARRAISSSSTTSRSSPSSTAHCRPPELIKGYRAAFIKPSSKLLGPKFKFARHGQSGTELSELLPHLADGRRRHRGRQGDGHRRVQPRARPDHDEHRRADLRPAEHGRLGHLRARQRVAGPARLRRLQHGQQGAERGQLELGQRLLADRLPGRPVPHQRRSRPLSLQPPRRRRRTRSATRSTPVTELNRIAARDGRRSRDRHPDQLLRDGLPHAANRLPT